MLIHLRTVEEKKVLAKVTFGMQLTYNRGHGEQDEGNEARQSTVTLVQMQQLSMDRCKYAEVA